MDARLRPRCRRLLSSLLLVHLCLAIAHGQDQPRFEGEGRVVAVDAARGMVTLDHGPISGLMPAMRMAFPVQQVELLKGLQVGDMVRFSLQPRGPEWVIATIEPAEDRPPPRPVIFPAPDFALPTTYLLDQVGNVVVREIGGRDWTDDVSQMAVQGLLP